MLRKNFSRHFDIYVFQRIGFDLFMQTVSRRQFALKVKAYFLKKKKIYIYIYIIRLFLYYFYYIFLKVIFLFIFLTFLEKVTKKKTSKYIQYSTILTPIQNCSRQHSKLSFFIIFLKVKKIIY